MRIITKAFVHHSITPRTQTIEKTLASFNRTHKERLHPTANSLGYHIAYHYLIFDSGEIVPTREEDSIGYHAGVWLENTISLWICLVGSFDDDNPSENQLIALWKLLRELQNKHTGLSVHFHRDVAPYKSCPWNNITMDLVMSYVEKEYEEIEYVYKKNRIEPDENGVIKFKIMNYSNDIHKLKTVILFNNAFGYWWAILKPIRFEPTKHTEEAQIKIWFAHPWDDILPAPFKTNSLAYALPPYWGEYQGHIYINDDLDWNKMRKENSHWLMKILVHEIGHALNIPHQKVGVMKESTSKGDHVVMIDEVTEKWVKRLYREFY